jgi:hypothetical protein
MVLGCEQKGGTQAQTSGLKSAPRGGGQMSQFCGICLSPTGITLSVA